MADRRRRKKKGRNSGTLYRLFSLLVITAALVAAVTLFFKLTEIEVVDSSRYTAEEVIAASGVIEGDNLLFINKTAVSSSIFANLVYADTVTISRQMPNKLVISVVECEQAAYIDTSAGRWIIDAKGKVLESAARDTELDLTYIQGLDILAPSVGSKAVVSEGDSAKLNYVLALVTTLKDKQLLEYVTEMDASNVSNIKFSYRERFVVEMGVHDNIDYKLEYLGEIEASLPETERGTIFLSGGTDKKMHFIPE